MRWRHQMDQRRQRGQRRQNRHERHKRRSARGARGAQGARGAERAIMTKSAKAPVWQIVMGYFECAQNQLVKCRRPFNAQSDPVTEPRTLDKCTRGNALHLSRRVWTHTRTRTKRAAGRGDGLQSCAHDRSAALGARRHTRHYALQRFAKPFRRAPAALRCARVGHEATKNRPDRYMGALVLRG